MFSIKCCIREDARLQEVVAEVMPLEEMGVNVRQRRPECLQDHLSVLLADDLVPYAAGRIDVLLSDSFDLGDYLRRLALQNALEDADGVVEQVRHRLLELAFWRHIDGL